MKQKRLNDLFTGLLVIAAVLFFCLLLFRSYNAAKEMGGQYHILKNADLSRPVSETIYYSDKLYAELGFGVSVTPDTPDRQEFFDNWLLTSVTALDSRLLGVGCVYPLVLGTLSAYPLYRFFGKERGRHILAIAVSTIAFYLLYLLFIRIIHAVNGLPFYFPARFLLLAGVSVLSLAGGFCALGALLRSVRYKKIAALLVFPLIAVLFLTGFVTEYGLYSPSHIDSFDYLAEVDNTILEEGVYDPERNAVIYNGAEYPPQQSENPDHFTGASRILAVLYETVNPFSGNQLAMGESTGDLTVPSAALAAYSVKALLWILLPNFLNKHPQ